MIAPFSHPVYIMSKPVGSACNLRCEYCYYSPKDKPHALMADEVLERFIQQYIEMQTTESVLFTWHGGEPTLRGLDFYRKVVRLQRQYAQERRIDNALQTNGTLLDADWCRFLRDEGWLVGISIDGPEHLHDAYRRDQHGRPTHAAVLRAIGLLKQFDVEWNAMATVNRATSQEPEAFYHFFKEIGCRYLQFTPVVERLGSGTTLAAPSEEGELAPYSVTPASWGDFLCAIFDEWVRHDVGCVFVQLFDATLANWAGVAPGVCTMAETCGHAAVMEADGSLYSCDHFVFPAYRLGNFALPSSQTLLGMLNSSRQRVFGLAKRDALPRQCRECQWGFACHGECPRNRFCHDEYGNEGLNYLCAGYRRFFEHVAPAMDFMYNELRNERPPANVMEWSGLH